MLRSRSVHCFHDLIIQVSAEPRNLDAELDPRRSLLDSHKKFLTTHSLSTIFPTLKQLGTCFGNICKYRFRRGAAKGRNQRCGSFPRFQRDDMRDLESSRATRRQFLAVPLAASAFAQTPPRPENADLTPEEVAGQQHYNQALRPQFHYTPIQGDLNDATGLIYYRGEYHLFHMYDEWSRIRAAHKRWGHAVSSDLVHWEQLSPVLDTAIDHTPGSGSGVVDWNNCSGFRSGAEKTLIIFYTDYQRGTCIAYSSDRGRSWTRYGKNPVIAGAADARDPLVFWYSPADEWRMVRYEKRGFAFYKSSDLLSWTWLSRVEGYFECPDFFELPVVNMPDERRWVLVDGNGTYALGTFDGRQFAAQGDKLRVEYGKALYATQTWKRTIDGGPAYQMAWMRQPYQPPLTWNGQMCFPVELTLQAFPEGIRLCRQPIDEIENIAVAKQSWSDLRLQPGEKIGPTIPAGLLDIEVEIEPAGATEFGLVVRGHPIRYSMTVGAIGVGPDSAPLKIAGKPLRLRILVDRPSIEVFADKGQVTFSTVYLEGNTNEIVFTASGGDILLRTLTVTRLESIWLGRKPVERQP